MALETSRSGRTCSQRLTTKECVALKGPQVIGLTLPISNVDMQFQQCHVPLARLRHWSLQATAEGAQDLLQCDHRRLAVAAQPRPLLSSHGREDTSSAAL